jgi:hypothetical protein
MIENKTSLQKPNILRSLRKLSTNQKIAMSILAVLLILFPIVVYGVYQQTLLLGDASTGNSTSSPVPNEAVLQFRPVNHDNVLQLYFLLDTKSIAVDGVQMVVYTQDIPNLYSITDKTVSFAGTEVEQYFKVVANEVVYEPSANRYRITLGLISKSPQQPVYKPGIFTIGSVNLVAKGTPDPNQKIVASFDGSKTKVISNATGENLAIYQPSMNITFAPLYTPPPSSTVRPSSTPTSSATAAPTSVPTGSPSPVPTPLVFNTTLDVKFRAEGFTGTNAYNGTSPSIKMLMWNPNTRSELNTKHVINPNIDVRNGLLSERMMFSLSRPTGAVLYLKPDKHLSIEVPMLIEPSRPTVVDITSTKIPVGDLNNDNRIDIDDYHRLVKAFNPTRRGSGIWEDLNYDGKVDLDDYVLLARNYNPNYSGPAFPRP